MRKIILIIMLIIIVFIIFSFYFLFNAKKKELFSNLDKLLNKPGVMFVELRETSPFDKIIYKQINTKLILPVGIDLNNQYVKPEKIVIRDENSSLSQNENKVSSIKKLKKIVVLSPDRAYEEAFIYADDKRIARERVINGNVFESVGNIPDGKIEFINKQDDTYGYDIYKDGKKHGNSSVFFPDGRIKKEIFYQQGKIVSIKEYYDNGVLRFMADYKDARDAVGSVETGVGKIFFKDGRLKYEWNLTKSLSAGYKKAYDKDGKVLFEKLYDANSRLIKEK